jgi:uncharacterized delta-60 repeat protein
MNLNGGELQMTRLFTRDEQGYAIGIFATALCRRNRWKSAMLFIALMLALVSSAFAKGGDYLTTFPVTAAVGGKQEAKAMAVDSSGNIIVAGYNNIGGADNEYRLVKFNANGSGIAWSAAYNFSGGDDQIAAVAVDGADNVIVTGTVWNSLSYDIHTIKYRGDNGSVIWQQTWSGPAGGADIATSLAIDTADNIYVAGYTANAAANDDFLVIKYPAAGTTPLWQIVWDSEYHNNDRITAIAAGTDGIAVTGYSSKGGTDFDIYTQKYGLDGAPVWTQGQRRASAGSGDDRGAVVKMDPSGNVVVAGQIAAGATSDMITIKYDAVSGNSLWEKIYQGVNDDDARGLWIDGGDDIYVTGTTFTYSGNEDIYTVRYRSTDGAKVWSSIYDAGSEFADFPLGIVIKAGSDGGVFVTGYTSTNINETFTTLKYNKGNGELVWQKSYNGPANKNARPVGIALDAAGGACVAGWNDTATNSYDFVAIKYDFGAIDPPTGLTATATSDTSVNLVWRDNSFNETGFKIERKLGHNGTYAQIGTTGAGVTTFPDSGLTSNSFYYYRVKAYNAGEETDYSAEAHAYTKVISYDTPSWVYTYDGNREDEAVAITVGADNHPVVSGFSDLTEEGVANAYSFDYVTLKLNRADKSLIWKARYDSGDGGTDMAAGVAIDSSGDTIVTGTAYLSGGSDKSDDLFTIKYNTAGYTDPNSNPPFAWSDQYGTQAGIDQATAVQTARDASNNVVVIGHGTKTVNSEVDEDMFIIKYLANGSRAWPPIVYDGAAHGNDYPSAVAFDAAGNIFVTGSTENSNGNFEIYTAKYNGASGALIWSQTTGSGSGDNHGLSLVVDTSGDVYMTGYGTNAASNEEWLTIKYAGADSTSKREIWRAVYNGPASPANGNDRGIAIALDPIGNPINDPVNGTAIVVAGTSYTSLTDSDFHLIRYRAADGVVIWERNVDRPATYDYVTAMAIDSSGYIYVTGTSRSGPDTTPAADSSSDVLSVIYDYEGTFIGATTYDSGQMDVMRAIAVNYQGEAFAAGVTENPQNVPDYLVVKQAHAAILVPAPLTLIPQADSGNMNITWRENTVGTKFQLDRTPAPVLQTSVWTPVTTALSGTTSFPDSGLSSGVTYCYRIYAYKEIPTRMDSRTIISCSATTLAAPTLSPLTVDSTTQITLNWGQIAGNSGYRVERRLDNGDWTTLADNLVPPVVQDSITTANTGLSAGTNYSYRVSTSSAAGYSLPSNVQSATTLPAAPAMSANGTITATSVVINWTNVAGESGYRIEMKEGAGGSWTEIATTAADIITYTKSDLLANSQYYFRVRAYNASGNSAYSGEQGALTLFVSPTLTSATGSSGTQIDLVWTDVAGETGYKIQEATCNYNNNLYDITYCTSAYLMFGVWTDVATVGVDVTNYARTGRNPGYAYIYRIIANTSGNSSAPSNTIIAWTAMTPPTLTVVPASQTALTTSWTNITAATNYTLQRKQGGAGTYADVAGATAMGAGTTALISYSDTGLAQQTEYCYQVKAYSTLPNNPPAVFSNEVCKFTPLAAPVLSAPTVLSDTRIDLSWSAIEGNTGYEIERCPTSTPDNPAGRTPGTCTVLTPKVAAGITTFSDTTLTPGYTYRYRVRDTYGTEEYSGWSSEQWGTTVPPTPTLNLPSAASTSQLNHSFTNVYGETSFTLEWKERSGADCTAGDWSNTITIGQNQSTYNQTGLATGTFYCFRLYAVNGSGRSGYSAEQSQTTQAVAPTLNALAGVTTSQVVLDWNNVTGNTGYTIERKTGESGTWSAIYTAATDATTYTNTGLAAGTRYYYRVSTNNAAGSSAASNEQFTTTTPIAPTFTAAVISAAQIDLSWPVVFGATNYKIERKEGVGSYSEITNLPVSYSESYCGYNYQTIGCPSRSPVTTSLQNADLTENTTYCYRLKAWNSSGGDSVYSTERCATTLPIADQTLTATPVNSFKIRLDWTQKICTPNPCDLPDGYEIERLVRDGNWVKIATVGAAVASYTDRIAIDPIKQYRYRIRSYSGSSKSPYTEAVTYTPPYTPGDNVGP